MTESIKTVLLSILTSAGFVGTVWLVIRVFAESKIKTFFQKKLEGYKHEVNLLMERSKFESCATLC